MSIKIENQLKEIEKLFSAANQIAPKVSARGVDWHIDHSLKVFIGSLTLVTESNPSDYAPRFNFTKFFVFSTGIIPRGKAKAPKATNRLESIDPVKLEEQLAKVKDLLTEVKNLPKNSFFKHPYFGDLNKDKTLTFLGIHTKHHLKIIKDIQKALN